MLTCSPLSLTIGDARDLGPRYIAADKLALVRNASANLVSQNSKVHVLVEEPEAQAQTTELEATEADQDTEMVTRRKMTVDRFLPVLSSYNSASIALGQGLDSSSPCRPCQKEARYS